MALTQTPDLAAPRSAQPRKKGANLEKWGWIYMRCLLYTSPSPRD